MTSTDTSAAAIIYLRLSDFRDEDDLTFTQRQAELEDFAASLGLTVIWVAIENDLNGNGRARGASAYKTPRQVRTPGGLITFRTHRPVFESVVLQLQQRVAGVLIVSDHSRIARDERDGLDLLDACQVSGASAVAPDDDGNPRWILTRGGTHDEVSAFRDRISDARRYSDDVAAKVRKGRRRWAGKSYQGGRRPFGYQVQADTSEHRRNLVIDQAEAGVIRQAAADILDRGISLKAIARGLRERDGGVPTATGARWSAEALRAALLKPTVAGLAIHPSTRELIDAPWPAILDRDRWERLRAKLTDPSRRTNQARANEPRWLMSGFAQCGTCLGLTRVSGGAREPAYVGKDCCHLRRSAAKVDEYIEDLMIARLSEPDVADLLRPPARPGTDPAPLRAELGKLARRRASYQDMAAAGDIEPADLASILKGIRRREEAIGVQLAAAADEPDPLAEFRDPGGRARAVWDALPMARRRAVVQHLLASVVIERAGRGVQVFDDRLITTTWNDR